MTNNKPTEASEAKTEAKNADEVTRRVHDPDAAPAAKTRKDGGKENYYGYQSHTLVRVPQDTTAADAEPRLIARLELTPAPGDVVDVSLSLLDRLKRSPDMVIGDRHYHYKRVDRWRDQLAERGITQTHDLRSDEQGFTDIDHVQWAAGWPHCPGTPDRYGTIPRPEPTETDNEKRRAFRDAIDKRFAYAFRRVTTPDERGVARWECPAIAGKVGCPLRDGTVEAARDLGLPIVEDHPDPKSEDFPACCSQRTVTIKPAAMRKLMQPHYWGSKEWERVWNKRTYIEGSFGNLKNPSTENLRRGHSRVTGLALVNITVSVAAAAYNLRMLRAWHDRTGNGPADAPLLKPAEKSYGYLSLSPEEHQRFLDHLGDGDDPTLSSDGSRAP